MDDLFPDLQGFTPRASTSRAPATHGFAIDPALAGSSASRRQGGGGGAYWDDEDEDADAGGLLGYADDDSSLDGSEYETDTEDELAAATQTGTRRADKGKGRAREPDNDDGGGGDDDDDIRFQLDDQGEQDLDRLISAIRESNSTQVGGATALGREFDRSIADELDAFDPEMMENLTVGVKGKKKKNKGGKSRGRRAAADVEPSPEVKRLIGQANQAYAEGSLDTAVELLSEVVRIDPIIRVSWYTLATIYEEKGDQERAVQCKIVATHLLGKDQAAAEWASLGRECRQIGLMQQAIYCFTQAIKVDKEDVDTMWDRAVLLKLSDAKTMAIKAFSALLTLLPHDPGALRQLAPLLADTQQYARATSLLLAAFAYYRSVCPLVSPETVDLLNTYGYSDLETLADFLLVQRNYKEVVRVIRQGVRWLQGREKETGWDRMADDREYDEERRIRPGWESGEAFFEDEPTYELDVRLRSRLGLARLGLMQLEEAQHHFDIVTSEDVAQFPELFGAIGEAFYERKMYDSALDVYQLMAENEETNGPAVWSKIGMCHQATGDLESTKECYENVVEEEPNNMEAKLVLAKLLEQLGDPSRALQYIKEVIARRQAQSEDGEDGDSRRKKSRYTSREERAAARTTRENAERERHAEFVLAFSRLQDLDEAVNSGDDDAIARWLEIASVLVDSFRSTRQLFPGDYRRKFTGVVRNFQGRRGRKTQEQQFDAEADQMANRLERTMISDENNEVEEHTFRGLHFDEWVQFILRYCFLLADVEEVELAAEVLLHVREAGVFRQVEARQNALRWGLIACYLRAHMFDQLVHEFRYFMLEYPSQTEPLRLFLALLSHGQRAIEAFNGTRVLKFALRQLKVVERAVLGPAGGNATKDGDRRGSSPIVDRKGRCAGRGCRRCRGGRAHDGKRPRLQADKAQPCLDVDVRDDAARLAVVSASDQRGLRVKALLTTCRRETVYLLRAYELDKPQPLVNLTLATAYIQRAMSRKTDNRQHQIAQAFAFLDQYRRARGPSPETEYNFARAFHHIGLQSYAIKHYEAVLDMISRDDQMPVEDETRLESNLSKAAAYNLVTLYSMSGLPELARAVAETWLSA
ncbi:TPR-like protein [Rhodotorula sp. JG-1b]|nr:TPR-like protein [Rhodotorula sp. JG-1b]